MHSFICTLFENHYHFGVAALANSLYHQGYRGELFAGYRGNLPPWASSTKENPRLSWEGGCTMEVTKEFQIHFLPVKTDYHLTNYKPEFMLKLWDGPARQANICFYLDPDIVVIGKWQLFEQWTDCGLAVCEDVNSPLAENHPRRIAWRRYFRDRGISLRFKENIYANGGFLGLSMKDRSFLSVWKTIQEEMAPAIGGLNCSQFDSKLESSQGPFTPFGRTDQDALNASIEAWDGIISFVGQEGMAFKPGLPLLPHALGTLKPWKLKPLHNALKGCAPRLVDRCYWNYVNGPIYAHSAFVSLQKRIAINIAALIGRFYHRN